MSGYFGTEAQRRLQATAEEATDWIRATPGACQSGRFISCDDPERLGWDVIEKILKRDGACSFRMIPVGKLDELSKRFAEMGYRFDEWDVFTAEGSSAINASNAILARGLPDDLMDTDVPRNPEDPRIIAIQRLMADCGVVPFSGSLLTGQLVSGTMTAVKDRTGAMVAVAYGYLPHNSFSPYHRDAFGGLVAVAEPHRGKRLGNYINAKMITRVFSELDAERIYEVVSETNAPSRKMVEACGLRLDLTVKCGIAVAGGDRFTR